jgi:hypothetical protein
MKEAYPVQVAEYAVANKILEEPAFAWWAQHVLRKRDCIIRKVKSPYWSRTHKFSILLPKSLKKHFDLKGSRGLIFGKRQLKMNKVAQKH